MYYVYDNHVHQYAKLHRGACIYCNDGKGFHPGRTDANSRWLGGFGTREEALAAAKATAKPSVDACKVCAP